MAALLLIASVALPATAATMVVSLAWPKGAPLWRDLPLKAALGTGLGLGFASCAYFLWLSVIGPPGAGYIATEAVVCALASVLAWHLVRRRHASADRAATCSSSSRGGTKLAREGGRALTVAFGAAIALAALGFVIIALKRPHGGWDAWAIWNLRARFLFRGGEHLADAFARSAACPHTDYPLLVPASVARAWTWAGGETVLAPIFVAAVFTFVTYLVATFAVASLRGPGQGLAAGLMLVATAHFTSSGAMQFADAPTGFFVLAAVVMLVLADEWRDGSSHEKSGRALVAAGAAAGLAAWTKNEGLAFAPAVALALALPALGRREGKAGLGERVGLFGAGLLPALVVLVWFKSRFSPGSEYLDQGLPAALSRLADFARYPKVGLALLRQIFTFGNGAILVLVGYTALAGLAPAVRQAHDGRVLSPSKGTPAGRKPRVLVPWAALGLTGGAYLGVYLISPHDLDWQLATSLGRLLFHLWPAAVFLVFLVTAPVETQAVEPEGGPFLDSGAGAA